MNGILTHYRELLALTQLYLQREFPPKTMISLQPSGGGLLPKQIDSLPLKVPVQPKQPPMPAPQPQKIQAPALTVAPTPLPPQTPPARVTPKPPERIEKAAPPIQAPAPQTQIAKPDPKVKTFALEPISAQAPHDLNEFWKLHQQLCPELSLAEEIPKDAVALKIKNAWKNEQTIPPVVILSFRDQEKEHLFLKNVAQAISLRLAQARVISASKWEKENGWENLIKSPNLRLIIATDYDLYLRPELMKVYREAPQQGKHYLHNTPLLLLSDLSLYLKEPQLKSLLWRAICNEFATPAAPLAQ